ncbi:Os01g0320700, partial [Oryza sativa Japonica Group]
ILFSFSPGGRGSVRQRRHKEWQPPRGAHPSPDPAGGRAAVAALAWQGWELRRCRPSAKSSGKGGAEVVDGVEAVAHTA